MPQKGEILVGAWGVGVFENDGALNWLDDALDRATLAEEIAAVLATTGGDRSSSDDCITLAAAEVVAMLRGHPAPGIPDGVHSLLLRDDDESLLGVLTERALAAVEELGPASELRELWFDEADAGAWADCVHDLVARLGLKSRERPSPPACPKAIERAWSVGDVLALPLGAREGVGYAQILSRPEMDLYATLALTTRRGAGAVGPLGAPLRDSELFAVVCLTFVDEITSGTWPLVGSSEPLLTSQSDLWPAGSPERCAQPEESWDDEDCTGSWEGLHGLTNGGNVVSLMRAYHALCPWPRLELHGRSYLPYLLPAVRAMAEGQS